MPRGGQPDHGVAVLGGGQLARRLVGRRGGGDEEQAVEAEDLDHLVGERRWP